jgi:ribosomal protein S18 acetylase RimI-like enzyme
VTLPTIRQLQPGDGPQIVAAGHLFDSPPDEATSERFLASPGHYLLMAFQEAVPAGFVSGVELTHPDKGTEMFLYELAVDEPFRRRGIGTALVEALLAIARARGCYDLWVMTDHDNDAALATYRRSGTTEESSHVMLTWDLSMTAPAPDRRP